MHSRISTNKTKQKKTITTATATKPLSKNLLTLKMIVQSTVAASRATHGINFPEEADVNGQ